MAKLTIKILLLNLSLSLFGCQNHDEITPYLDQLHSAGKFNGNVLVIKNNDILFEKSFGYADASKNILLTKDHRFNVGSIYKEFPAASIMQLQENNRLKLNDKISKYLPSLPAWAEEVSIKNLMQYSSGLPQIAWGNYFGKDIEVSDALLFKNLQTIEKLEFKPGSDYLYSNYNPILLIKIIETISQLRFTEYLEQHIFPLAEMNATVIQPKFPYKDTTLMALPFDEDFNEDMYSLSVNGLLFSSTTHDLANWFKALGDFKVVNNASVATLSETIKTGDNIQSPLGACRWKNDTLMEHSHHGSSGNYECIVKRFKQEGITIVILTNQKHGNVHEISNEIYNTIKKDL